MRKNIAAQTVSFGMVSSTDGSAVTTGTPAVYYTIDGGTQGTGAGTATHEGQGQWSYAPAQAETNGNHVAYTMVITGAINQTVNVWPVSFDPTDAVRMGITALPNAAADAAGGLPISDLGALDLDALNTAAVRLTAARAQVLDDWVNAGRLDVILDLINTATAGLGGAAMRGTDGANTVIPDAAGTAPTAVEIRQEMDANSVDLNSLIAGQITISGQVAGLNDFDPAADTVQNVAVCTANTDMRGTDAALLAANYTAPDNTGITANGVAIGGLNDLSFSDIWTGTLTESYAVNGAAMTPAQAMHMTWSDLRSPKQTGLVWNDFKLDNTTVSMTFSLDNAAVPTVKTRTA